MPTILMCPPDFYGIEYEINPWMSRSRASDTALARQQWEALRALLTSLGCEIPLLTPAKGLPDLVFTANAALIWRDVAFLSRFRHAARQGETPLDEAWFQQHGLTARSLPEGMNFEGAGDALFCGETLFGGYIIRSDARALQWVAGEIGCRVIPLQLVDTHFYHLDTCFCPISPTAAIWHPPAFDDYAQTAVREHVPELIAVNSHEAARFACNAVVVGRHVVLNTGCPQLEERLSERGFTTHATPLDEFIKAGGSAKCLTLRLDGEDAAQWPAPAAT
ncbi:MAG: amidinotransferase [Planctomycetaceae bacterium]|nr:amidinotransferase [Planctomycetaceae bacterium]